MRKGWPSPLPVDEILLLQVFHGRGDLGRHVQKDDGVDLLSVAVPEVVQEVPVRHELGDDIKRRLPRTDTCGVIKTNT